MLKILAGDWKPDSFGAIRVSVSGKPKAVLMPKGFMGFEKFKPDQIESCDLVNEENKSSILGKAAWGVAGAALLGGVGALAGVLGGGNKKKSLVSIVFKDGRKALVECSGKDLKAIIAFAY